MDSNKTPLEKLALFLSANPYILAAGWLFTVVGGIITIFTVNTILGIVIMILFSIFLLRVPKYAPIENNPITEQVLSKSASSEPITLSSTIPPAIELIGRNEAIQAIRDLLKQQNIVSIHADGGVGKTAVAVKIANEVKDEMITGKSPYQHIAWITSTGNLKHDLIGLNISSIVNAQSEDEKYQAVYLFLQATPSFLVIDNMDEPPTDDEADILNTIAWKTRILITSRAVIPYVENYDLKELNQESALILFYSHYQKRKNISIQQIKGRKDYPFAREIVEAAVDNALFVELIGKAACVEHLQLDTLWRKLKTDVFGQDFLHAIHTNHAKSHHRYKDTLLTQIQKLYEMSNLSEKQKEIMYFIALFPAEHSIFFDVFKWAGFEDDKEDHLGALQDRGWIDRDDEGYLIHTMVQRSLKLQSGKVRFGEERYENLIVELADTKQYIPKGTIYTKVRERIIVPETVCGLLADNGSEKENTATLFNNLAGVQYAQGNYEKALEYNEKALQIMEKVLGLDHPYTATAYNNTAEGYYAQGEYEKAFEYYEKALAIREKVQGPEHPDTATTYNNTAGLYYVQGKYEKALEYFKKALAIREKVLGPDHLSTATSYNNIALVYSDQGEYEKAFEYYEKAIAIKEKTLGLDHPETATTYNNMGSMYHNQGKYEKALKYYEKALVIREKVLGPEHPDTVIMYNNIAGVYYAQEKYEKALEYYEKAVEILDEKLGPEHPTLKIARKNIDITKKALTSN